MVWIKALFVEFEQVWAGLRADKDANAKSDKSDKLALVSKNNPQKNKNVIVPFAINLKCLNSRWHSLNLNKFKAFSNCEEA